MSEFPSTRQVAREGARFGVWAVILGAIALVVIVALSAMAIFGVGLFQRETANFRGETAEREKVLADPNYRIANYTRFFDLCASVQNKEATIRALEAELNDPANPPSAARKAQINATITANRAQREAAINQYNASAAQEDTRANFHASNLPYRLDAKTQETTCAP